MASWFFYDADTGEIKRSRLQASMFVEQGAVLNENTGAMGGGMLTKTHSPEDDWDAAAHAESRNLEYVLAEGYDEVSLSELYISAGVVTYRTPFPQLTVNNGVLSGIPTHTVVRWPDGELTIEHDGEIEFESNVGGDFVFQFLHPHHYLADLEVEYNV